MKKINVVLVGQPNVGKSLLINALCKTHMKVGNFPGVTVEKASSKINYKDYEINFVDLPGIYALDGYSQEEKITKNYIENEEYDIIVNVVDSTNLERNLVLSMDLFDRHKKIILALNMQDEADNEGILINTKALESLLKVPCVNISARTKQNLKSLLDNIIEVYGKTIDFPQQKYSDVIEHEISKIGEFLNLQKENKDDFYIRKSALALLKGEQKSDNQELNMLIKNAQDELFLAYDNKDLNMIFKENLAAYAKAIAMKVLSQSTRKSQNYTRSIDAILANKYLGIPIFLFFMWVLFQLTFTLGQIPMDYIEAGFSALGDFCKENISNEFLASVLADGIIAGVGSVVLFLPNIIILFLGIALLETTGYMSRITFLLDGILYKFGLHGKSFIPLITGFGCSVPAFMATRTLKNKKDKLLTLFIINFMSCGARLPVYVLFIGAFFPSDKAGNYLFGIYILGAFLGLLAAKFLRMTAFRGADEPFVMEMPKYRMPNWNLVWFMVYNKAKMYLKKAGTFILLASILIWFASNFPKNSVDENLSDVIKQELAVENSYLGQFGKVIEPVFAPLDFDWKLSVSLVSGLAAKEVMISTMGVLYALGNEVDEQNLDLRATIAQNIPFSTAVAYILFVMIYNPCFAATIVFAKESGKMKYAFYLFIFTCTLAYIIAFIGLCLTKFIIV